MNRSYLYAPGHEPALLAAAFGHGVDAVVFDLEDGVPAERREEARANVVEALRMHRAWVRVNPAGTVEAEADLAAVGAVPVGIRLPKTQSPADARWLLDRAPGMPVICSIESRAGLAAAAAIAAVPGVWTLSLGSRDLTADLGCEDRDADLRSARERLVEACRSAGSVGPVDSVFYDVADLARLRAAAESARRLGFSGKSTLWPEQVKTINAAFG